MSSVGDLERTMGVEDGSIFENVIQRMQANDNMQTGMNSALDKQVLDFISVSVRTERLPERLVERIKDVGSIRVYDDYYFDTDTSRIPCRDGPDVSAECRGELVGKQGEIEENLEDSASKEEELTHCYKTPER